MMKSLFPEAPVLETDAGHFLQEEVPEEIAAALMRVLAVVQGASLDSNVEAGGEA